MSHTSPVWRAILLWRALLGLRHNVADLHLRVGLAMPDGLLVLLLTLEFEDDDFVAAAVANNGGLHIAAGNQVAAFAEGSLSGQFDFRADFTGQFFHAENVARSHPVLFPASLDNRVHANLNLGSRNTRSASEPLE